MHADLEFSAVKALGRVPIEFQGRELRAVADRCLLDDKGLPSFSFVHLLTRAVVGVGDDEVSPAGCDEDLSASFAVLLQVIPFAVGLKPHGKPDIGTIDLLEIEITVGRQIVVIDSAVCPDRYFDVNRIATGRIDGIVVLYL